MSQEQERLQARQDGYQRALYELRDALLVSALAVKSEWQSQLVRDGDRIRSGTDARFVAQLEGLNAALSVVRQMEPRITTQLQIDQFREAAVFRRRALPSVRVQNQPATRAAESRDAAPGAAHPLVTQE